MTNKYTRAVRDPIHSYIQLTEEETTLIDSPLVFPGAQHSRLAHGMGVMHLAGEYAAQVFATYDDLEHRIQLARLGGVLHDVGHGPFSHAYDDTVYRILYPGNPHGHDTHRMFMVKSDYLKPLIENCGVTPKELKDLWEGKDRVMQAIVQGALGADRMDFMLRDAYYSGTTHFGSIASKRLISNALIADHDGIPSLHYNLKVLEDIFQSLLGRFYMYRGVYFHKASAAADILIRKILDAAKLPLNLADRTKDLEEYQYINEYTLLGEIMASQDELLQDAKHFTKRLFTRDLPKLVWEAIMPENQIKAISGDLEEDSRLIAEGQFIKEVRKEAKKQGHNDPNLHVTNTYPMSTIDSKEFDVGNIFIYDDNNILEQGEYSHTLYDAITKTTYFRSFLSQVSSGRERYVILRVFADRDDAKWIRKFAASRERKTSSPSIAETSY
ncbi:MAG: HD domain-containing protein [Candidatus Kariarchaeaceae archaeon]